jgi:hypothetical protein
MVSPLSSALDAIQTAWIALTPASEPARTYRRETSLDMRTGTSAVGTYVFEVPFSAVIVGLHDSYATWDYELQARVRDTLVGVPMGDRASRVANRAVQLMGAANRVTPPANVRSIRALSFTTELQIETDPTTGDEVTGGDLDLLISLIIRTQETD